MGCSIIKWATQRFLNVGYGLQRQIARARRLATTSIFLIFVNSLYFFTWSGPPAHWWASCNREFLNRQAAMRHGRRGTYTFFSHCDGVWCIWHGPDTTTMCLTTLLCPQELHLSYIVLVKSHTYRLWFTLNILQI